MAALGTPLSMIVCPAYAFASAGKLYECMVTQHPVPELDLELELLTRLSLSPSVPTLCITAFALCNTCLQFFANLPNLSTSHLLNRTTAVGIEWMNVAEARSFNLILYSVG